MATIGNKALQTQSVTNASNYIRIMIINTASASGSVSASASSFSGHLVGI